MDFEEIFTGTFTFMGKPIEIFCGECLEYILKFGLDRVGFCQYCNETRREPIPFSEVWGL